VAVAEGRTIQPHDLPTSVRSPRMLPARGAPDDAGPEARGSFAAAGSRRAAEPERDAWSLARVEEEHIRRVLAKHGGNATAAAKQLGISRTTLWRKLRAYGISRTAP
jgi:propionate catabolism operon transcriptional regulator